MNGKYLLSKQDCLEKLTQLGIEYILHEHQPGPTMAILKEMLKFQKDSALVKSIFYVDKKSNCYLVLAKNETQIGKQFWKQIGLGPGNMRLSKQEHIEDALKSKIGHVNPFALLNDDKNIVKKVVLDDELLKHEYVGLTPIENTATIEVTLQSFKDKFLTIINKEYVFLKLSDQEQEVGIVQEQQKVQQLAITIKKNDDFSKWYQQTITKAELIEYYDVSGCYIIRPWGYYIWEKIQEQFNEYLRYLDIDNTSFPMFVTEKVLKMEQNHIEGFSPEVAWVTKYGDSDLKEKLAIRPTSETIMYPAFAKWIHSHRDLPLKINQWSNIIRWEFKQPTPFIRTREFLWQEGHTAHANEKEAKDMVLTVLQYYKKIYEEVLAVPVILGIKTESEKFAGGDSTYCIETIKLSYLIINSCLFQFYEGMISEFKLTISQVQQSESCQSDATIYVDQQIQCRPELQSSGASTLLQFCYNKFITYNDQGIQTLNPLTLNQHQQTSSQSLSYSSQLTISVNNIIRRHYTDQSQSTDVKELINQYIQTQIQTNQNETQTIQNSVDKSQQAQPNTIESCCQTILTQQSNKEQLNLKLSCIKCKKHLIGNDVPQKSLTFNNCRHTICMVCLKLNSQQQNNDAESQNACPICKPVQQQQIVEKVVIQPTEPQQLQLIEQQLVVNNSLKQDTNIIYYSQMRKQINNIDNEVVQQIKRCCQCKQCMNSANGRLFPGCNDFYCLPHFESYIINQFIYTGKASCRLCNHQINEEMIQDVLGLDAFNKAKQDRKALESCPHCQTKFQNNSVTKLRQCTNELCKISWCSDCKLSPYHYLQACGQQSVDGKECRYCKSPVTTLDPKRTQFQQVCENEDCKINQTRACIKMLQCEHPCLGLNQEECLPCLYEDCQDFRLSTKCSEVCSICCFETLEQAPCVQSECGHIFHYHCVLAQLEAKWPQLRISFDFLCCPICRQKYSFKHHNTKVQNLLIQYTNMEQQIQELAFERFQFEGLDKSIDNIEKRKQYASDKEYSLHIYVYYQCAGCKAPYFGGAYNCQDIEQPIRDPSELLCSSCSGVNYTDTCKIHGDKFIEYKCKFCCNIAIYFCWGTTHFCKGCHDDQVAGKYLTKKPKHLLPKCKGPQICPTGGKHIQNGEEMALWCQLCQSEKEGRR